MSAGVTYYCIPNKRKQFVAVYEPYPWGRGVLRVAERRAVRLGWYRSTADEDAMVQASPFKLAVCFDDMDAMLRHADAAGGNRGKWMREWLETECDAIKKVLAEVNKLTSSKP